MNHAKKCAPAMTTYSSPTEARSVRIQVLNRWWVDHAQGDIPDRSDLHPDDLKTLLPYLLISDVEHNPFRIRYRLVGHQSR